MADDLLQDVKGTEEESGSLLISNQSDTMKCPSKATGEPPHAGSVLAPLGRGPEQKALNVAADSGIL